MPVLKGGPADGHEIPDRGRQVEQIRVEGGAVVLDDSGVPLRTPITERATAGQWLGYHRQPGGTTYRYVAGLSDRPPWYGGTH